MIVQLAARIERPGLGALLRGRGEPAGGAEVAANIYVYCSDSDDNLDRDDLEDALAEFFGRATRVCGSGAGSGGFNRDYALAAGEDPHSWADRLKPFLARLGVPPGTAF